MKSDRLYVEILRRDIKQINMYRLTRDQLQNKILAVPRLKEKRKKYFKKIYKYQKIKSHVYIFIY